MAESGKITQMANNEQGMNEGAWTEASGEDGMVAYRKQRHAGTIAIACKAAYVA